jgi:hypothetical protein
VLGATSMIHRATGRSSAVGIWLRKILERRPARLATVALANKMARIAWAIMARKEVYRIRPPKTLDQARLRDDDLRLHFFARPCTA